MTVDALARALLPLSLAPDAPGWNRAALPPDLRQDAPLQAAVLIALREYAGQVDMLFTRRNDALRHHPGQVSFPGGSREAGDATLVDTALREAHEEIGLPADLVHPLGYLDNMETISGFRVTPVVAQIHGTPSLHIDPREVAELFSVPLDYVLDPQHMGYRDVPTRDGVRRVPEIHHGGHIIWGATAMMLLNLQRRMGLTQ